MNVYTCFQQAHSVDGRYYISFILHEACSFLIVITTCTNERKMYHLDTNITKSLFHPGFNYKPGRCNPCHEYVCLILAKTCQEYIKSGLQLYSSMFTGICIINHFPARKKYFILTEGPSKHMHLNICILVPTYYGKKALLRIYYHYI